MPVPPNPLQRFHPLIGKWFTGALGQPTDVQIRAWEEISAGRHVLVTAPTGSGKTLAAFLWAINQLVTGAWPRGETRVLYISPLKALNNDVRRNLHHAAAGVGSLFHSMPECRFPLSASRPEAATRPGTNAGGCCAIRPRS